MCEEHQLGDKPAEINYFFPLSKSILLSRFIELFLASPSCTKPLYSYRFSLEETGGSDEIGKYKFLVAVNDTWGRYETK